MGKHILAVDDQETIILFLRDRLEKLGFEVATASNGLEGLEVLKAESITGILLDLEMPIMNGLTMLNRLQQRSATLPVIMMSADPTWSTMIKAIEGSARDFLLKPISGFIFSPTNVFAYFTRNLYGFMRKKFEHMAILLIFLSSLIALTGDGELHWN